MDNETKSDKFGNKVHDALKIDDEKTNTNTKYPKIAFLILANEFCERLSYYGFRAILYIFFTSFLQIQKDTATALYHSFTMLAYFTPILGAILADGYIGLYKTILFISLFYASGQIILSLTSMAPLGAPSLVGPMIGLIIIGLGTGGIKPCVSSFGGNQFRANQSSQLATFFSLFYLCINIGSIFGTLITPIFRSDIKCFDNDCYPLAFGFPALLMILATVVFVIGTPYYRRDNDKPKGSANIISVTAGCIIHAIRNKLSSKNVKKKHWLDYAEDSYSHKVISDVKIFCKVVFVFLPLPLFWTLFDQQGSRWTSQAQQLDGRVAGYTIKPDQFQAVNSILIVLLVPVFDFVIYPLFAKIGFLKKKLPRISVGLVLTVISFLVSAFLEYNMDLRASNLNPPNKIKLLNLSPCGFNINMGDQNQFEIFEAEYLKNKIQSFPEEIINELTQNKTLVLKINGNCKLSDNKEITLNQNIVINNMNLPKSIIFYLNNETQLLTTTDFGYEIEKAKIGFSEIKFNSYNVKDAESLKPMLSDLKNPVVVPIENINMNNSDIQDAYESVSYSEYKLKVLDQSENTLLEHEILLETTTKYTVIFFHNMNENSLDYILLTDVHASGIHIGWQFIQYFVMTSGEVMVSISGLAFAYSEAPQSMKSVLSACWLLTVAVGNLIVVIIAEAKFVSNQVYEYLLFAGLLVVAFVLFLVISFFYKYTDDEKESEELTKEVIEGDLEENGTSSKSTKSENEDIISLVDVKPDKSDYHL